MHKFTLSRVRVSREDWHVHYLARRTQFVVLIVPFQADAVAWQLCTRLYRPFAGLTWSAGCQVRRSLSTRGGIRRAQVAGGGKRQTFEVRARPARRAGGSCRCMASRESGYQSPGRIGDNLELSPATKWYLDHRTA